MVEKYLLATVGVLGIAYASNVQNSTAQAVEKLKERETAKVIKQAAEVVRETRKAVELLKEGKGQKAEEILERIEGKLKLLIDKYGLKKLPLDVEVVVYTGVEDLKKAQEYNKRAKELIVKNDFVNGRLILNLLRDEVDVITTYIPLYVYKDAIDLASKMLKNGNAKSSLLALQSAINTLEVETEIIPKPILEAQYLLGEAQKIYKQNPERATAFIKQSEYNLKLAVALGYVSSPEELKTLLEKLENLKKAVETGAATTEEQFKKSKEAMERFRKENTKRVK